MQNGYDLGEAEVGGMLPRRGTQVEFVVRFNPTGPLKEPAVCEQCVLVHHARLVRVFQVTRISVKML